MRFKRQPIYVQAFHFDVSERREAAGIGVQLHKLLPEEIDQLHLSIPEGGCALRIEIPFDFVPPQEHFAISGIMKQLIIIEGFDGTESDLPADAVKKLSRPIIELIETLTYEITTLSLDHAVNLNFVAKNEKIEDLDNYEEDKSTKETE